MEPEIALGALRGHNPRGLFAALGALDVATRQLPHAEPKLRWSDGVRPHAVLTGPQDLDDLVALCVKDLRTWARSPVLRWGPHGRPLDDLKPNPEDVPRWLEAASPKTPQDRRADVDLLAALVSEGAVASTRRQAKPTHFHFTAGNQRWLRFARDIHAAVDRDHFRVALTGPWSYGEDDRKTQHLRTFRWDVRSPAPYAYRARDPSEHPMRWSVPGADWLAFLGLRFFPVVTARGRLVTTGCEPVPEQGSFTWPLWTVGLEADTVRSLLGWRDVARMSLEQRRALGVSYVLRAPIHGTARSYKTFGPPDIVLPGGANAADR